MFFLIVNKIKIPTKLFYNNQLNIIKKLLFLLFISSFSAISISANLSYSFPNNDTIVVENVYELGKAINSGANILLKEGSYDLSNLPDTLKSNYYWFITENEDVNSKTIVFRNINDLSLIGEKNSKPNIINSFSISEVLSFENCNNIKLINLNIYQETDSYKLEGIKLSNCENINITNINLIKGSVGVEIHDSRNIKINNTFIDNCSLNMLILNSSNNIFFRNCIFKNNDLKKEHALIVHYCNNITFDSCLFEKNKALSLLFIEGNKNNPVSITNSSFIDNKIQSLEYYQNSIIIENSEFINNEFDKDSSRIHNYDNIELDTNIFNINIFEQSHRINILRTKKIVDNYFVSTIETSGKDHEYITIDLLWFNSDTAQIPLWHTEHNTEEGVETYWKDINNDEKPDYIFQSHDNEFVSSKIYINNIFDKFYNEGNFYKLIEIPGKPILLFDLDKDNSPEFFKLVKDTNYTIVKSPANNFLSFLNYEPDSFPDKNLINAICKEYNKIIYTFDNIHTEITNSKDKFFSIDDIELLNKIKIMNIRENEFINISKKFPEHFNWRVVTLKKLIPYVTIEGKLKINELIHYYEETYLKEKN
ncbi:MAG: right-handed parallel beta-helix repeat-containing protein [Bacteroidales bacterium]|nr:right-handed parallel beta-helix repeat-containing protein [Bacteroidales bacterium]